MNSDKPFIHLLRSPNFCYFYDVNRNTVKQVSDELYNYLLALLGDQPADSITHEAQDEYKDLLSNGYLSSNQVMVLQHPYTPRLKHALDRNLQKLTLQVTQQCNLKCGYCTFSHDNGKHRIHSEKKMEWDIAKKLIDFYHFHSIDSDRISLSFYGGEPLLAFDLVQRAVLYAESKFYGKEISFTLTSNGTIMTDEILSFLVEHDFALVISLDGPQSVHDHNRKFSASNQGSFKTIMNHLSAISIKSPDYIPKIMFNMVVDYNCKDIVTSLSDITDIDLEPNHVFTNYVDTLYLDESDFGTETYTTEFPAWRYQYHDFLAFLKKFRKHSDNSIAMISKSLISKMVDEKARFNVTTGLPNLGAPSGQCIPGQARLFANTEGYLFPCETVSETDACFIIGHADTGFDYEQCEKLLNIVQLTPEECRKCFVFSNCNICARMCVKNGILSGEAKMKECIYSRKVFESILRTHILVREIPLVYRNEEKNG